MDVDVDADSVDVDVTVDVVEELRTVEVYAESVISAVVGMSTGQKVHVLCSTDQYMSSISRRYPTDRRLDMHFVAAVLS
jgi:hypothetical protein